MIAEIDLYKHYKEITNTIENIKERRINHLDEPIDTMVGIEEIDKIIEWFDTLKKEINGEIKFKDNLEIILDGKKEIKIFSVEELKYIDIKFNEYYDNCEIDGNLYNIDQIYNDLSAEFSDKKCNEINISISKNDINSIIKIQNRYNSYLWSSCGI